MCKPLRQCDDLMIEKMILTFKQFRACEDHPDSVKMAMFQCRLLFRVFPDRRLFARMNAPRRVFRNDTSCTFRKPLHQGLGEEWERPPITRRPHFGDHTRTRCGRQK